MFKVALKCPRNRPNLHSVVLNILPTSVKCFVWTLKNIIVLIHNSKFIANSSTLSTCQSKVKHGILNSLMQNISLTPNFNFISVSVKCITLNDGRIMRKELDSVGVSPRIYLERLRKTLKTFSLTSSLCVEIWTWDFHIIIIKCSTLSKATFDDFIHIP